MFVKRIFKAYDIRGLAETELSPQLAYRIGRAFVHFLRLKNTQLEGKSLVVGYDMRPSSPGFKAEVIRGIQDEGVNVVDIGMCSTPLFNFTCAHFPEYAGGIMVTASHNPAEDNGFKLTMEDGLPVPGKDMFDLVHKEFGAPAAIGGKLTTVDPIPEYFKKIFSLIPKESIKPLKIVIDFGNGMGSVTFKKLLQQLPQVQAEYLYEQPDGTFPNHEANPIKTETLKDLQKKVLETAADFGFALDGDADRIGWVAENGEVVEPSIVGGMLGLEVLKKNPGGTMLYTPNFSQGVVEEWERRGAKTHMCPVGHANVKKQMKQIGAIFGSEISLHVFFKDVYDLECSDLALVYLLNIVSREGKPVSEIVKPFKKYFHSGEFNFRVADKDEVLARIQKVYEPKASEVSRIDGVWMRFDWGWMSVRTSNTEPLLRVNLEANTEAVMREKIKEVAKIIEG